MILPVTDLDIDGLTCDPAKGSIAGASNVRGQAGVCANHGAFAVHSFRRIVARYSGEHKVKSFLCMAFAQLTFGTSKRACAHSAPSGIRLTVAHNRLDNANSVPPWQIYALDTTTIDLCLSVFPWARFCSTKAVVK